MASQKEQTQQHTHKTMKTTDSCLCSDRLCSNTTDEASELDSLWPDSEATAAVLVPVEEKNKRHRIREVTDDL